MDPSSAEAIQQHLNLIWIILAAALVFLMQAGFAALESGLTRAKNTINVALKNILDFTAATVVYFLLGFGLMFGASNSSLFGASNFALSEAVEPMDYAFFIFQATFAGTAATIISGAVAERIRFIGYVIVALFTSAFIYPISGYWIWSGEGWLAQQGFIDFAGSTVVHSVGAWIGLAGAIVLGPRIGRYNEDGRVVRMQGHNQVMAVIGVLILWFGWFGFNGGSTLLADGSVPRIIVNTSIAAAAGGVAGFLLSYTLSGGDVYIGRLLNGIIGGLVGITAGCHIVSPWGALWLGFFGGVVAYFFEWLMAIVWKIDDPINVVPAHGFAGVWGTVGLVFFAEEGAFSGTFMEQLGIQLMGAASVFAWAFGTGLVLFLLLKQAGLLRVPPDAERIGLNIYEHGTSTGLMEIMDAMKKVLPKDHGGEGNLQARVPVEVGTEAGDIGTLFNILVSSYNNTVKKLHDQIQAVLAVVDQLERSSHDIRSGSSEQLELFDEISGTVEDLNRMVRDYSTRSQQAKSDCEETHGEASQSLRVADQAIQNVNQLGQKVQHASDVVNRLGEDTESIVDILNAIKGIAGQTNLLALNAAIEAARAGEQGKGFAVVAEEVRSLAFKVEESTQQIQDTIDRVVSSVDEVVKTMGDGRGEAERSMEETGQLKQTLDRILSSIGALSEVTGQFAETASRYDQVTGKVNTDIKHISAISRTSSDRAKESSAQTEQLLKFANELNGMIAEFQFGEPIEDQVDFYGSALMELSDKMPGAAKGGKEDAA
ncbi:MAG: ammonium transporter [Marinobacter sp.]|uniref:ammonium transporter n=1 Tax=Marinobacter sp. TaxID=50741 RepID=UPI00299D5AD9|nr:ammonium transporter [Marinobacter sp.]MDX1755751.1 ammonium transporter [Marinobacter sp.]